MSEHYDEETGGYDLQAAFEEDPLAASVPVIAEVAQLAAAQATAEIVAAEEQRFYAMEAQTAVLETERQLAEKYGAEFETYRAAFYERVNASPLTVPLAANRDLQAFIRHAEEMFTLARLEAQSQDERHNDSLYWQNVKDTPSPRYG